MSDQLQEWIALGIVALVFLKILCSFFKKEIAKPLSQFLLKKGKVKWAMKVHPFSKK
tara:strand:+ start:940 stop:1110 length:171 start_codon:yes stop_codon:yes gene_type:complete